MSGTFIAKPTGALPCPFCGKIPFLYQETPSAWWEVHCGCGLDRKTKEEAIEAWNTRSNPELTAAISLLRKMEWWHWTEGNTVQKCPCCKGRIEDGHTDNCELAKMIKP